VYPKFILSGQPRIELDGLANEHCRARWYAGRESWPAAHAGPSARIRPINLGRRALDYLLPINYERNRSAAAG